MKQYAHAQISVGILPEWYNEDEHDFHLETAIENKWEKVADAVGVEYNYQTENAIVSLYDEDGNLVSERDDHDLQYAFDFTKRES